MSGKTDKLDALSPLLPASFASARARLPRLLETYRTLFREVLALFRWKLLPPLLYGAAGIVLQVLAIGIIFQFAKHLIKDETIVLGNFSVQPRESLEFLVAVSATCLVLLILSAVFSYLYNSRAVAMSCLLEKHCMNRLLEAIGRAPSLRIPKLEESEEASLIKIAMNDTRACGRSFLLAFTAVIPMITFLVGVGMLFLLHWQVTLLLTVLLTCFFGALYRVSLFGVESSRNMEKFGSKVRKGHRDAVWFFRESSIPWSSRTPSSEHEQSLDAYLHSYGGLLGLSYRSSLVGDLFLALTLTAVLLGLSMTSILGKEHHWGTISAYLIGLQYSIRYLKQTLNSITICNRFFPQVSRFFATRHYANDTARTGEGREQFPVAVSPASVFHPRSIQIVRGTPVVLCHPKGVSRYNAPEILDALLSAGDSSQKLPKKYGMAILSGSTAEEKALRESLTSSPLAEQLRREMEAKQGALFDLSHLLAAHRVSEILAAHAATDAEKWDLARLRKACFALSIFSCASGPSPWVFIHSAEWRELTEGEQRNLLRAWRNRFVFLFHRDLTILHYSGFPLPEQSPAVLLGQGREVLWAGTVAECRESEALIAKSYKGDAGSADSSVVPEGEDLDLAEI